MCWNASSSISAFILGIFISLIIAYRAYKENKKELMVLSLGWTWVICMQFFEYKIWTDPDHNIYYSKLAFVFNITQIIVLYILFISLFDHPLTNKIVSFIIILFYISYMLYHTIKLDIHIKTEKHLHYSWWEQIPFGGFVYLSSLIALFLLLVRPMKWSLLTLFFILIFLLFSFIFYKHYVPSMWCFFAVSIPLISYLISI